MARINNRIVSNLFEAREEVIKYWSSWEGRCLEQKLRRDSQSLSFKEKDAYARESTDAERNAEQYVRIWNENFSNKEFYAPSVGGKSNADYVIENYVRYIIEAKQYALRAGC